jgi:hypothetical protein
MTRKNEHLTTNQEINDTCIELEKEVKSPKSDAEEFSKHCIKYIRYWMGLCETNKWSCQRRS